MRGRITSQLSLEAQELVKLTTKQGSWGGGLDPDVDVGTLLTEHPNLVKGMKEYLTWRDNECEGAAETKSTAPLGHESKGRASEILRKGKKK